MLPMHGPVVVGEPMTPGEAGELPRTPGVMPVPPRLLGCEGGETGPPALGKGCPWMVAPTDDPVELGPVPTEPMLEPGAALEGEFGVEPWIGEVMLLLPIGLLGMPGGVCAPVMGAAPPERVCA